MKSLPGRSQGGVSEKSNIYTRQEKHIQQVLAVASASISLISGLMTFYWFARMEKRKFRHQLIMLLIASGMFKALWCWIPPVTILARGKAISYSLCQSAGFLFAVGVEASGSLQRVNSQDHLLNLSD